MELEHKVNNRVSADFQFHSVINSTIPNAVTASAANPMAIQDYL